MAYDEVLADRLRDVLAGEELTEQKMFGGLAFAPGASAGLVRAALPNADEIVLSMERMNAIEEVDVPGGVAIAQAGTPLQKLQERVEQDGMMFPLDLGARGPCGPLARRAPSRRAPRRAASRRSACRRARDRRDRSMIRALSHRPYW